MLKKLNIDYIFASLLLLGLASIFVQSITLAVSVVCFSALHGFDKWRKDQEKPDINAEIQEELKEVKNFVASLSMRNVNKANVAPPADGRRLF